MNSRRIVVFAMLVALGAPNAVRAQSTADDQTPRWLRGFKLRQAFDGGKDEQQPAVLSLVVPHGGAKPYGLIDVAVKRQIPDVDVFGRAATIVVAPAVEYHQAQAEALGGQGRVHKLSPEVLVSLTFSHLKDDPGYRGGGHAIIPFIFTKYAVDHDYLTGTNGGTIAFLAEPYSKKSWVPGGQTQPAFLRYVPSGGVEYFNTPAIKDGDQILAPAFAGWTATARLYVEWYPLNPLASARLPGQIPLVALLDCVVRKPLGSSSETPSAHRFLSVELNYYFDTAQAFGIGYTHSTGESVKVNFLRQRRDVVAFKVKL